MVIATRPQPLVLDAPPWTGLVRLERLPWLEGIEATDVAEALRDLPGLALLESARPQAGPRWTYLSADPLVTLAAPAPGDDPFASARRLLGRLDAGIPCALDGPGVVPPFLGGLVGFLGYELGAVLEPRVAVVPGDQDLPVLQLALHDWAVAWDVRTGRAYLGGRALDGDVERLNRRLADVRARLREVRAGAGADRRLPVGPAPLALRSNVDRATHEAGVERIRDAIAAGELYQANLTRRLEAPFDGDPWPLYRALVAGDPAPFAAYLDLGRTTAGPRAIVSASPESFLSVRAGGFVTTSPIKGTRPRGRNRAEDRRLAAELLSSAKDRAENVMIVDVLRNDLGRVSRPGSVRVPRLNRLQRAEAVQHLVSTVTGTLRPGLDPFDLLAAAFPGGSITGAPKVRAMELLAGLEPVARGPYTGALGWIGPDGAMTMSILIRTFVADGRLLTLHVGGGITWRSDPAEEWAETVAKARGPLRAIGAVEAS